MRTLLTNITRPTIFDSTRQEIAAARKGLRRRLRDLDEQYREEAQSLRTAYEQQRQTILDVLETL